MLDHAGWCLLQARRPARPEFPNGVTVSKSILCLAAVAVAAGVCSRCWADPTTITLGASHDATIFQNNVNNGSGGGNILISGTNGAQISPRRALIEFDIAGQVPAGSLIQQVQLTLVLGQFPNVGAQPTSTIGLHRVLVDWGEGTTQQQIPPNDTFGGFGQGEPATEGDVTWNARFFSATTPTLWATPGGEFAPTAGALTVVSRNLNTGYVWSSTPTLVSDVQSWLDVPSTNFGWLLLNIDETTPATFRGFYSRHVATEALRPVLSITYLLAGDFDGSGVVAGPDFVNWKGGFGTNAGASHMQGDANGDGDVDGRDFLVWQQQFGAGAAASAAPEPGSAMLAWFCAAVFCRRVQR